MRFTAVLVDHTEPLTSQRGVILTVHLRYTPVLQRKTLLWLGMATARASLADRVPQRALFHGDSGYHGGGGGWRADAIDDGMAISARHPGPRDLTPPRQQ